mgnify:CR=1 FL=1|tara:strand:- start:717 stop:1247 length:531 start_codon:yes stop_codon:yes gene_type:complete
MKSFFFNLFILFLYLIPPTLSYSIEHPKLKNLIFHKEPKILENIEFKNIYDQKVNINEFKGNLIVLNFWATWCAPCRDEMPSLDRLSLNNNFKNLKVIAINIGKENVEKSKIFFEEIKINNLEIFYDTDLDIPKKLLLRGIPTTILINKNGQEFARILGEMDFDEKKLIDWLKNYD